MQLMMRRVLLLLQGLVTDALLVKFFTNATVYEDWPSGGLLGNGTGEHDSSIGGRYISCCCLCVYHSSVRRPGDADAQGQMLLPPCCYHPPMQCF